MEKFEEGISPHENLTVTKLPFYLTCAVIDVIIQCKDIKKMQRESYIDADYS